MEKMCMFVNQTVDPSGAITATAISQTGLIIVVKSTDACTKWTISVLGKFPRVYYLI